MPYLPHLLKALTYLILIILSWLTYLAIDIHHYAQHHSTQNADAAIVLGAAIVNEQPSPVFAERINHSIQLYQQDKVKYLIFTGGRAPGDQFSEAEIAQRYALQQGIPCDAILIETISTITYENLVEAQQHLQQQHLHSALLVSDPLHMKRAMHMATDLGIKAYSAPTPTSRYQTWRSKVPFLAREVYFYVGYLLMGGIK